MRNKNGVLRRALVNPIRHVPQGVAAVLGIVILAGSSQATIFRCVDSNGTNTFSDKPCGPMLPPTTDEGAAAGKHPTANAPAPPDPAERARETKASQILQLLPLASASESDAVHAQRMVDLVAPDLVKQLDPANPAWTPQQPRWHQVLEFIKSDMRKDAPDALRAAAARTNQAAAHEYAAHAQDADMDALTQYLHSPDGSRYVAFQSELRSISGQALESLMAQEPIAGDEPSGASLGHRRQLLSMDLDFRIAVDGKRQPPDSTGLSSPTVMESAARREGNALDTLYSEYEAYLPGFATFTQSTLAKRYFAAIEPALRTSVALSSTAIGDFAEAEAATYQGRWRGYYGPPVRGTVQVTTVVRAGPFGVISTRQSIYNGSPVAAEAAAIQCEQRENATYQRTHRSPDPAAMKAIQNTCRQEQNLPPL